MAEPTILFVGLDVHKEIIAMAHTSPDRSSDVVYVGQIGCAGARYRSEGARPASDSRGYVDSRAAGERLARGTVAIAAGCRRCAGGRTRRPAPHARRGRRCGTSRSRSSRAAGRWRARDRPRHDRRRRSGGRCAPPPGWSDPPGHLRTPATWWSETAAGSRSRGLAVAQTFVVAIRNRSPDRAIALPGVGCRSRDQSRRQAPKRCRSTPR